MAKKLVLPLISAFLVLFTGCTTVEFVRKDISPKKQAVVRYFPPSSSEKEAKYREELNKQAHEFCGGDFQITKEYQQLAETGSSAGIGTGVGFGTTSTVFIGGSNNRTAMYNFVEFECVSK